MVNYGRSVEYSRSKANLYIRTGKTGIDTCQKQLGGSMKKILTGFFSLLTFSALMVLAQSAWAYDTYSSNGFRNCASCHGAFLGTAPYVSKFDGVAWSDPATGKAVNLHDGHRNVMLSGDCNTCHMSSSKTPVYTYKSAGGTGFQAIGCTGCHDGDGLRAYHKNTGASSC